MTKATSLSLRLPLRAPRLLPFLLLFAGLLLALAQFFAHDPDGGSGIGGTGRFGGESGLGGTGGPLNLSLDDIERERENEREERNTRDVDARELMALASAQIDVQSLRLSPEAAPTAKATQQPAQPAVPASPAALPRVRVIPPQPALAALPPLQPQAARLEPPLPGTLAPLLEADLGRAANAAIDSSLASTQLMLAEADLTLPLPTATEVVAIDVMPDSGAERLRLSVPVRPERPDRPSLQAPRITAPPRSVPAPPVRPMRL